MKTGGSRTGRKLATALLVVCGAFSGVGQQSDIQQLVARGQMEGMRWPNFIDYRGALLEFYEPTGFAPAWVTGAEPTPAARSLIEVFRRANDDGLDPEDYDAPRWQERVREFKNLPGGVVVARFDVALTVCAMRYIDALYRGRVNPLHLDHRIKLQPAGLDLAAFLRTKVVSSSRAEATFAGIEPPFAAYRRTEKALAHYVELARLDDGEQLPAAKKAIDPGQTYEGVPRLTRLLRLLGDLPPAVSISTNSRIYDAPLVNAVKHFQRRHGLDEDGRLGASTIRQMNVPLQQRVRQLQFSLERWRWLPHEFSAPPIFVNIPEFRLRVLNEDMKLALEMRVVVGRAMRTQTPIFSAEMSHIVFRPYWNVPRSIVRKEIVPDIERNRNYVADKNFEVTTHEGQVVTAGSIADDVLDQLREGKLTVRQKPGNGNALGLVKLMFPNENNVYLHDTPTTKLFSRARRDFSHGCIRVEKPAELAAWALRNNPGWTLERVREAMESGKNDVTVKLTKRIPVFIVYGTAIAYENGEVDFRDDIYGFDAKLAAALAKGYPYL